MSTTTYVTTAIPYVNGDPHLGHALEFIQADAIARHRRARGQAVRYLSGTDDHAFKNVLAAEAAGQPVAAFVDARADRFAALREPLELSYDAFIRTSVDPRHRAGVERLWRACAAAGDLYQRDYEGRYCTGCEAFLGADELVDGRCPEHAAPLEHVVERNWFFRLSRYREPLEAAIASGALRVEPETRRNEVLAVLRGGLDDLSVSRASERARGWGIPVPGDPSQTVYVWFDALANYVTELGYAGDDAAYERWWRERRRAHPRRRQGHHALPRALLARHPALGRAAAADARPGARLPDRRRRQDRQVQRQRRRPGGGRRGVRRRRAALVGARRRAARRRRRRAGRGARAHRASGWPTGSATSSTGRSR